MGWHPPYQNPCTYFQGCSPCCNNQQPPKCPNRANASIQERPNDIAHLTMKCCAAGNGDAIDPQEKWKGVRGKSIISLRWRRSIGEAMRFLNVCIQVYMPTPKSGQIPSLLVKVPSGGGSGTGLGQEGWMGQYQRRLSLAFSPLLAAAIHSACPERTSFWPCHGVHFQGTKKVCCFFFSNHPIWKKFILDFKMSDLEVSCLRKGYHCIKMTGPHFSPGCCFSKNLILILLF